MPKRTDATQQAIVEALRGVGATVVSLHTVGHGVPDLLVAWRHRLYLIECKSPGGKLTPDQREFIKTWGSFVYVCEMPEQALAAIGAEVS
jgi:hypothetical protein